MRSLMHHARPANSIVLAAIIVAAGIQSGCAPLATLAATRRGASVPDLIGFPMVNELRQKAAAKITAELGRDPNKPISVNRAREIADSVRDHVKGKVFDTYELKHLALTQWRDRADPSRMIPMPREGQTLAVYLGPIVTNSLLDTSIHEPLLTRLEDLAHQNRPITDDLIDEIANAIMEELSTDLGCWECIPKGGELRWYNSCTGEWGGMS